MVLVGLTLKFADGYVLEIDIEDFQPALPAALLFRCTRIVLFKQILLAVIIDPWIQIWEFLNNQITTPKHTIFVFLYFYCRSRQYTTVNWHLADVQVLQFVSRCKCVYESLFVCYTNVATIHEVIR